MMIVIYDHHICKVQAMGDSGSLWVESFNLQKFVKSDDCRGVIYNCTGERKW